PAGTTLSVSGSCDASCAANIVGNSVHGICGPASGQDVQVPTAFTPAQLCTVGIMENFGSLRAWPSTNPPYVWTCRGTDGNYQWCNTLATDMPKCAIPPSWTIVTTPPTLLTACVPPATVVNNVISLGNDGNYYWACNSPGWNQSGCVAWG